MKIGSPHPFESQQPPHPRGRIDELVFERWEREGLPPPKVCSDAVFVRRIHLDAIGTLPTADEAEEFIDNPNPDKRQALAMRLLERDEFADYWAMKWGDLLRIKAEFPINLWPNAAQAYHRWVRQAIASHMPYDQFVRTLLTSSGSNFNDPPVNFYRAVPSKDPAALSHAVALAFMGTRIESWPAARRDDLAAFFSQVGYKATSEWKEEIVFFKRDAATGRPLRFPDGTPASVGADQDPREAFAAWLTAPANPWFARAAANRVWYWLMNRGIVHEPDDLREDNPPSNPRLLEFLQGELVSSGFDLRRLFALILTSETYALSPIPEEGVSENPALFRRCAVRRLEAEVLIDAFDRITGGTEDYSSSIPEPFTFIPHEVRSIALPDGSITSSFLANFGRPARDTGLESERNNRISAAQKLWLLNSSEVQRKLGQAALVEQLVRRARQGAEVADELFLEILSRRPTDRERETVLAHLSHGAGARKDAVVDLAWALVNSTEFVCRH